MNSVGSNNLSLKYLKFTPLGLKNIGIKTFDFVVNIQFLSELFRAKFDKLQQLQITKICSAVSK